MQVKQFGTRSGHLKKKKNRRNTASKSYQLYALGSLYLFNPNKVIYARVMKSLKGS